MAPFQKADPCLDSDYNSILLQLESNPNDSALKVKANNLALKIRIRCIDLATWKADSSPEYSHRIAQCTKLTELAGQNAHEILLREFKSA